MFPNYPILTIFISACLLTSMMLTLLVLFYTNSLRKKSESSYNDAKREVELSMMRASFENKISELNKEMTATKERWSDVNSLIISSQINQNKIKKDDGGTNKFISSYGIDEKKIIINKKQVFVLTPFSSEEKDIFFTVRNACNDIGLHAIRGDEIKISGDIMRHIILNILKSEIIIANISSRNPNVFFELGISMALGKKTIIISHVSSDVPFDISTNRIIFFSSNRELRENLKNSIHMNFLDLF